MNPIFTRFLLFSLLIFTWLSARTFEAPVSEPVVNGDNLSVRNIEVQSGDQVQYVFLIKYNQADSRVGEYRLLDSDGLTVAGNELFGDIRVEGLDENDQVATVWVVMESGTIHTLDKFFSVSGELAEDPTPQLEAGTFTIADNSPGDLFQTGDIADATGSGFAANDPIFFSTFRELDSGSAQVTSTTPSASSLSIDASGNLSGSATRNGSAFNANTVRIDLQIFTQNGGFVTSTNSLVAQENDPPGLSSANVTSFTNIRLVFDEAVSEVGGDAADMFDFTNTDGGGITASALTPVGSEPTTTWDLTISGLSPDRDPDIDVAYDRTNSAPGTLEDAAGNEAENTTPAVTATDGVAPATPSISSPGELTIITGDVTLTGSAADGTTDGSMASVRFEGSDNGSTWTQVGQDTDTGDGTYTDTYTPGTKYAFYRAVAVDDNGNETASGLTTDLSDPFRVEITTFPVSQDAGVRGQFTITVQDNYADGSPLAFTSTYNLSSDQGTGTFYSAASGGSVITQVNIPSGTPSANFWYADDASGTTPTITVTEAGGNLEDDSDQQLITINAASVANFVITTTNGENETAGTAFDLTITAVQGDGSTTATDYTGSKSLTFSTTATASPDGTSPTLPANTTYTFTAGVATASSATLYNSAETPAITVTDGTVTTLGTSGAGAGVTVADGATAEVRIKTAAEAADGDYNNNVFGTLSVQGPTQADPDATTDLFAVIYDAFGNLVTPAETGNWAQTGGLVSNGSFSDGGAATSNTFTFSSGTNAGTTYTGTITVTTTTSAVSDATGTITVDDAAPGTVLGFGITTDSDNQLFVFANWNINSSGDDGLTGDPTNYEIRWTDEVNGPIDTDGEWDAASPVNTTGKPAYSAGIWRINMTGATVGNKYFAMRTTDDVGNISPLAAGAYTTTSDYSLPVSLTSYSAQSGYGKVSLAWVTESEINNEGFFIYRAASADGPFTDRVNLSIIEGQGNSNNPTEYTFVDESVIADQTYYYKLTSRDFDGTVHENLGVVSATPLALPETYALQPNYPNPFNPSTNFRFSLPEAAQVNLVIYNALGQEVKSILRNRSMEAGEFSTFAWDATDNSGNRVTSGVYYAVMTVESARFQEVRKLVYLR